MGSKCTRGIANNLQEELWSYFALSGLLFLHIGIVLMVYALKKAVPYPAVLEILGVGLIMMGVLAILVSWYAHRQHRQKKDLCVTWTCCSCCRCCVVRKEVGKKDNSKLQKHRKRKLNPVSSFRLFSTPEFRTYAEFVKKDTAGVESTASTPELKRYRVEPARPTQHVRPYNPQGTIPPQPAVFVNDRFSQGHQPTSQLTTMATPILIKLSD